MLFKLSLSNLKKSIRDYTVYFFTVVIGVAVFYVFNSIETQTVFLDMSSSTKEIIKLLISMLSGVSIFISIVLGLLIVYASRFLMKRRNSEFALYLILGMSKTKISAIIFIETFLIGLVSLIAGLGAGILISQFTSTFTASLFEANMMQYHFIISAKAILKTITYFGIMYIAVMLFNILIVGKCKLIDLIQSGKKSEKMKLKNPLVCILIFLAAVAALAYCYYNVTVCTQSLTDKKMMAIIVTGGVSTFLVFWSVSGVFLRVIMSAKKTYFRGLNSFTFRQLSSKINTMVMSMTVICLMLFVTICTLSSAFSMRDSLNRNIKDYCPADFFLNFRDEDISSIETEFSEYVVLNRYSNENVTQGSFLGDELDEVLKDYPYINIDAEIPIYTLSDYNALMKFYKRQQLDLDEDSYILVANFSMSTKFFNRILKNSDKRITLNGHELKSMYQECKDGFIDISAQPINNGIIIVPDNMTENIEYQGRIFAGNYKTESKAERVETENRLAVLFAEYDYSTKLDIADSAIGLGGVVVFLGLYIGVIFLISSGVILALRSLSDSVDSTARYTMLRKIGAEESEISKSVFRQNILFFLIPLGFACIHSIFGMKFAMNYVLQIFGSEGIWKSVAGSSVIILFIYGGYFLITYLCSKSIIKNRK